MKEQLKSHEKFFNWAALTMPFIYGLCNRCYIWAILSIIPVANSILSIIFAFKANEEAWEKYPYESKQEFLDGQFKWSLAGLILFIIEVIGVIMFVNFLMGAME